MFKRIKVAVLSAMMILSAGFGIAQLQRPIVSADGEPVLSESVTSEAMINAITDAGKGEDDAFSKSINMELFSYSIGYGKVDAENNTIEYHGYEVNSNGFKTSAVYNTANYQSSVLLTTGTARVGNVIYVDGARVRGNFNIIYRLTVNQDANVTVSHEGRNNAATFLQVNMYQKTATATSTLFTYDVPVGEVPADAYDKTFAVNEGDEFIFEFAYTNEDMNVSVFYGALYPDFTVSRTDALDVMKQTKTAELTAIKNGVVADDYAAADYEAVVAIYDKAIADVAAATEINALDAIINGAKADAADYLTTEGAVAYRAEVVVNMENYVATIDSSLYKAATYQGLVELSETIETAVATLTRKSDIDNAYADIVAQIVKIEKDMPVSELTTTFADIVNGVIGAGKDEEKGYNGYGSNQLVSYTVGYGRASKALSQLLLKGFEKSEGGLGTSIVRDADRNSASGVFTAGKIVVSNFSMVGGSNTAANANVLFELKAKENIRVTVNHAADEAVAKMIVKTYKTEEGGIYQLKAQSLDEAFAENAYGGVWTVAAGDSLYVEFAIEDSGFVTGELAAIPSFFVEYIEADELVTAIPSDEDLAILNSNILDMILVENEYGGGAVRAKAIDWQLLHGTVENAMVYEIVGGGVLRTERKNANNYNSIYAANAANKFVRTDPSNNEAFIVKITARENVKISVTSDEWKKETHSLGATYDCVLSHYDEETGEWMYYLQDSRKFLWPTELEAGVLNNEVHLNAGDVFYYVINGYNHQANITFLPTFTVDPAAYNADEVFDFVEYTKTQALMAEEMAKMQEAYDNLPLDAYTTDDYLEICTIYEEGMLAMENCSTLAELQAFIADLNAKVADFIKVADAETEKAAVLATMQGYIDALTKTNYKTATWDSILALKTKLGEDLDGLTKRSAQQEKLAEAKAALDLIKEDAKGSADKGGSGCGGVVVGLTGFAVLAAAAFVTARKKED